MVPSAIRWLLDHGADRVAYVDLDANHTDGVECVFWGDPRVLTISLHESGLHLFPHTGFPREVGGADARGTAVNVAFLPRTADRVWLHSFAAIAPPLIEAFPPQVIVAQHGADPHRSDSLADLSLSVDAMALAQRLVIDLADRFADGRWIGVGGGYHRDDTACVPKGGRTPRSVVTDTMTTHPVWECPIWNILASLHASWARRVTL